MPMFGKTRTLDVTPTVSNGVAYTAGDAVGGENVLSLNGSQTRRAVLKSLVVRDASNQKADLTVLITRAALATTPTDNGALALAAEDLASIVAKINIATADYETIDSKAVAQIELSRTIEAENVERPPFRLWVYVLTTGTPTYGSTSALKLHFGLLAD